MTNNQPQKISEFKTIVLIIIIIIIILITMKMDEYINTFVSNGSKKPTGNIGYILMLEKKNRLTKVIR